jgi:hypothetical protein
VYNRVVSGELGEIMDAIRALSEKEFAEIREWISSEDGAAWDRQIRADAASGRLDNVLRAWEASHLKPKKDDTGADRKRQ